ncbi:MAG: 2-amino-4-hydroxy-6-hydroxymethyldihydropteridine diphosphokinase, partial [Spongiibacteraceae bacterium]
GELCGDHAGVQLPRAEILYNAFVLLPLSELAPDTRHPECAKTYRQLWAEYENHQRLWPVPFRWGERSLSLA